MSYSLAARKASLRCQYQPIVGIIWRIDHCAVSGHFSFHILAFILSSVGPFESSTAREGAFIKASFVLVSVLKSQVNYCLKIVAKKTSLNTFRKYVDKALFTRGQFLKMRYFNFEVFLRYKD